MSEKKLTNQFVRDTYNKFLADYDGNYSQHRWFNEPISLYHYNQSKLSLLYFLKNYKYDHVLEIGGGDGQWTKILLDYCKHLDFYDISEEMIKQAKNNLVDSNSKITFYLGDFVDNDLKDGLYDFILSFRSFEYFSDKEKFLKETNRLLKEKGSMILVTKSLKYDWRNYYKSKTLHADILPIGLLLKTLKKNNFSIDLVKPAIVGKKLKSKFFRAIFNLFHKLNFIFSFNIIPLFLLQYISESFIIKVTKK